ncbi:MAG: hypothetical protein JW990_21855 [Thermoleophilia bacterium]|nr:hypothetical protein [Thermoleophilia bacterium]
MRVSRAIGMSLAAIGFLVALTPAAGCERASADLISQEQAVAIAMEVFTAQPAVIPTTIASAGETTTSTVPLGIVVDDVELMRCDAPGITGGKDMMVWTVHLGGATSGGIASARVYIDAATGDVLVYWLGP